MPSALSTHFSIAGCQFAMAQKSPIFFHRASGDIEDVIVTLDSSAKAGPMKIRKAAAATEILAMRILGSLLEFILSDLCIALD